MRWKKLLALKALKKQLLKKLKFFFNSIFIKGDKRLLVLFFYAEVMGCALRKRR